MRRVETHATAGGYSNGCRCQPCRAAWRQRSRRLNGTVVPANRDIQLDQPWVIVNFPVAIVARKAWPDDDAAVTAAFGGTP